MSTPPSESRPDPVDRKQAAAAAKEAMSVIDPLVRRVLGELADVCWGHNAPFRRKWTQNHQGDSWRVQEAGGGAFFAVSVDVAHGMFRIDCAGEPLFTEAMNEEHLRRALAVAHHRGPARARK